MRLHFIVAWFTNFCQTEIFWIICNCRDQLALHAYILGISKNALARIAESNPQQRTAMCPRFYERPRFGSIVTVVTEGQRRESG